MSNLASTIPAKPAAHSTEDQARWNEADLRMTFWSGDWYKQLEVDVQSALGAKRREAMGILDQSCCIGPELYRQMAVLHLEAPMVMVDGAEAPLCATDGPVQKAGLWPMMPDVDGRVFLCNEHAIRIDVNSRDELLYRPVSPGYLEAEPDPDDPTRPVIIRELILREMDGEYRWTWDELSVKDPENPTYRVTRADDGQDITNVVLGDEPQSGPDYRYRKSDAKGTPFIPYVLYHKEPAGCLWRPFRGSEVIAGTRMAAVLMSFWVHLMRNCCWRPRVVLAGSMPGALPAGTQGSSYMELDPTMMIFVGPLPDSPNVAPQLASWDEIADPDKVMAAIDTYATRIAEREGVPPSDLQRIGGTARSGYAISLTNEGKRAVQRRYQAMFRQGDEEVLWKSAAIQNRALGSPVYAEEGYQVAYSQIPMSPEEMQSLREELDWELEHNFTTLPDALARLHPGLSKEDAAKLWQANRSMNQLLTPPTVQR